MKNFVLFGEDTIFLRYKIDGLYVPKFQLAYIFDAAHTSFKYLARFCHDFHYMWWGNQELELQYF